MSHLVTPDGIGVELFQLIDRPHQKRDPPLEYWKNGVLHFGITDLDIEARLATIIRNGGRQLSAVWLNRPPNSERKMVYCADPWGTIIEIYTHSYGEMYSGPAHSQT